MKKAAPTNRTIVLLVEGETENAAGEHLKRFLDASAGPAPKVRLHINRFNGGLKEDEVRSRTEKFLDQPSTLAVIALTDVYPQFKTADEANRTIRTWMPDDPRCHVHVALYDFEAWLLVGWEAILKQAGVTSNKKPWGARPEGVNHDHPPAHRLRALFQEGNPPRKYKKPIDGKKLFEKLDVQEIAAKCPEFKSLIDTLLKVAGYLPDKKS